MFTPPGGFTPPLGKILDPPLLGILLVFYVLTGIPWCTYDGDVLQVFLDVLMIMMFYVLTGIPWCTYDGDVLHVFLDVLMIMMFYVLTGIPECTVDGDVLCTYRYSWVYC